VDDVNKPSIVLILADQVSAAALPAYGNRVTNAPSLDRLAAAGVVYERAYCASPLCVPSRASLMTGQLPSETGAYDNAGELPAGLPTFAHRLRLQGYRTVLVGKMHFVGPDQLHGFEERPMTDMYPAGFDWVPDWRLADDERLPWYHDLRSVLQAGPVSATLQTDYDAEVARRSLEILADADGPLLLVVSFTHPHDPYEVPHAYWDRYEGVEIDPPVSPEPRDDPSTRRLRAMLESDRVPVSNDDVLRARRGYYGAISLVDDYVGRILDAAGDDAVVVFTSDHGDMLGERGLWYKMAPFEQSIRVPLIVRNGREQGRVDSPVSLLDLAASLVDGGAALPAREVPIEYLAEGVRSPQVVLVRDDRKLVRTLGEPDLVYDANDEVLEEEWVGEVPWEFERLDAQVRLSQQRRRLVARALATGRLAKWDHPEGDARYIDSGDDFWTTLERGRRR
jgi:choline-sulfatase